MTSVDRWQLPDGIEEVLPAQAATVERLRRRLLDLFRAWGYELVIPPLVEFTDSLLIGLGQDLDLLTFGERLSAITLAGGSRRVVAVEVGPTVVESTVSPEVHVRIFNGGLLRVLNRLLRTRGRGYCG